MADADITLQVSDIIRDILEIPDLNVTRETTATMVRGWDSIAHIKLLMAIEEHFSIQFGSREMDSIKNVGDLIDAVVRHSR